MDRIDSKVASPPAVRPVRQRRSRATRDAILGVVERLVLEDRFDTSSVQDIVREAGSSIGAFYGRFADKNAALFSFYDDRCSRLERRLWRKLDGVDDHDIAAIIDTFIDEIVSHTLGSAPLLRTCRRYFFDGGDSSFLRRARTMNARLYMLLNPRLATNADRLTPRDLHLATWFCLALVGGLTRDALLAGAAVSGQDVHPSTFVAELRAAVFGYLGLAPDPR